MQPIAFHLIRACELQRQLDAEYRKAEWREAIARAKARWEAEGHKVVKLRATNARVIRKLRGGYVVD